MWSHWHFPPALGQEWGLLRQSKRTSPWEKQTVPCLFSLSLWQLTPLLLQPYSRKTGNKRGQRQGGKVNVMSSLWKVLFYLCTHTHTHTNTYIRICAQLCQTLCDPLDYSPLGSSVNGIFQARIPEWVAISSSRASSWTRAQTHVSYVSGLAGEFFMCWAIRQAHVYICINIY